MNFLIAALALFSASLAQADELDPFVLGSVPTSGGLGINVVKYEDILSTPGSTLRCLKDGDKYGYLITRLGDGDYLIDVISDGKVEGEKSRVRATLKDYGSPFIVYLSVYSRTDDYATYFELLLDKKFNVFYGSLVGDAMYTEAFYSKEGDKEKETLKPFWKHRMRCVSGRE